MLFLLLRLIYRSWRLMRRTRVILLLSALAAEPAARQGTMPGAVASLINEVGEHNWPLWLFLVGGGYGGLRLGGTGDWGVTGYIDLFKTYRVYRSFYALYGVYGSFAL
ncbi:hypothetical protein GMDG_07514 [Pseudogymnoascus destructans 20631-21]|uniref:Uncharacterized protein n=1 Tax=Pseudogymnoascus destructans (strain ATCC MYA-4855 / 20631-21) TaxID=658429 RepID=L8G161_PSED2|nr:hypothetical protein GMDG_07514 [Pseudogymnoascus destructans 20631-21]